jgi:hypothetical protein
VPHQLACFFSVRIGRVAAGKELLGTEKALTASDDERYHNSISFFKVPDRATHFDDDAHRLMAKHVSLFHSHHKTIVKMKIRPANRGRSDPNDHVGQFPDLGIGNRINSNVRSCRANKVLSYNSPLRFAGGLLGLDRASVYLVGLGKHKEANVLTLRANRV